MKIRQKLQKGVMMIEVVAVLGLIAAITPMLFQQISRRNDEILNVQVATEMRAVKEALAAYIQANESNIADNCDLKSNGAYTDVSKEDGGETCFIFVNDTPGTGERSFSELEPYFSGSPAVLNSYNVIVLGYTVPASNNTYRPFIYGIVAQKPIEEDESVYAQQGLKNASKIASLIGLDGGVAVQADGDTEIMLHGIQGSWVLDNFDAEDAPENTVVAITAFDTQASSAILKDVKLDHFKGISMQTDQAVADRISLREVLSVGDDNCIEHLGNTNVGIVKRGETAADKSTACVPFFEVDRDTGKVTVSTGVIESNVKYSLNNSSPRTYKLDLAGTSEMYDIKLTSLGGANLSDVIPKWTLKDVQEVNCSGGSNLATITNPDQNWTCSGDYKRGFIIIPITFKSGTADATSGHYHQISWSNGTYGIENDTPGENPIQHSGGNLVIQCPSNTSRILIQKYCVREGDGPAAVTVTCPANTYKNNAGKCIPCPTGAHSSEGSTTCTCPAGKMWNSSNNTCNASS